MGPAIADCAGPPCMQERFHPAAHWAFQAVAAAYLAGQLCFHLACAAGLFDGNRYFGCTGPAALLAGRGPLLLLLAPLLWGQWVGVTGALYWRMQQEAIEPGAGDAWLVATAAWMKVSTPAAQIPLPTQPACACLLLRLRPLPSGTASTCVPC